MADLVVTVPQRLWLDWIREGDAAGEPATGETWAFYLRGHRPAIEPGERLYIVAWDMLRGYAPVTKVVQTDTGWAICRKGGAVAVTLPSASSAVEVPPATIKGFRGWRRRWWPREAELPFPGWQTAGVAGRQPGRLVLPVGAKRSA